MTSITIPDCGQCQGIDFAIVTEVRVQDDPTIFSLTSHRGFVLHHYQYGVQRASFRLLNPMGKVEVVVCCVRMDAEIQR